MDNIKTLKMLYRETFGKNAPEYYLISNTKEYEEMLEYCVENEVEINEEITSKFLGGLQYDVIKTVTNEEQEANRLFNVK